MTIKTKVKSEMALSWSCSRNDNGLRWSLRVHTVFSPLCGHCSFFLECLFTPPWSTYKICTSSAPSIFTFLAIFYLVPGKLVALPYVAHWCLHLPLLEHIQQKSHPQLHSALSSHTVNCSSSELVWFVAWMEIGFARAVWSDGLHIFQEGLETR